MKLLAEILGVFVCVATLLPFIKTDEWWIRVLDFPRLQLLIVGIVAFALLLIPSAPLSLFDRWLLPLLSAALVAQAVQIVPYTPVTKKQVKTARGEPTLRVFVANVLQDNHNSGKLLAQIASHKPDLILLNETDQWWTDAMKSLDKDYPHKVLHPRTNTYGMNFYSRFELIDPEVRFLTDPGIPSIRTHLKLPGDRKVLFYGVHPRPPAIKREHSDERQDSAQRDAELVMVAKEIKGVDGPIIVAGDFNDVAWSHTTRLFQRTSRLLDPRVGRGLYNSYNAKTPLFRYPLDHLFHSDDFTSAGIKRLGHFGSDHFPLMASLRLEPDAPAKQEAPPPKPSDKKEAEEILQKPPH